MQNESTFEDACRNNDLSKLEILIKTQSSPKNPTYFGFKHKCLKLHS